MARAEDLRAVRTFLQEERYRIDMQLLDLDRRIMLAEHGAPPPVLNPGRRADDMPHPPAKADGVMLGVFDSLPRETPALVGMGDEGDDWHGATVKRSEADNALLRRVMHDIADNPTAALYALGVPNEDQQ